MKKLLLCIPLLFIQCTENPLFDEKVSADLFNVISGTVVLSDPGTTDSVYVWLEGLDYSTYTDKSGHFSIELPAAELQPGGGLNGIFTIYYFLANYRIMSSSILLINGKVQRNQGDIGPKGNIVSNIWLKKLLDIRTEISPEAISTNYTGDVLVTIQLTNLVDSVWVNTFRWPSGEPRALVITRKDLPPNEAIIIVGNNTQWQSEVITEPIKWEMTIKFAPGFFEPAIYNFYPLLEIIQDQVPQDLLKTLGTSVYSFSLDYLKVPYQQTPAVFTVSN